MVTRWGMSDLGLAAFHADESQPFLGYEMTQAREYSEAMAARIDVAVEQILNNAHDQASALLSKSKTQLESLATALLRDETLDLNQLTAVLGPPLSG